MAIGDVYELTHVQRDDTSQEQVMNKYFYRALTADATAADLIEGVQQPDGIVESVNALQSTRINNVLLRAINLFNLGDFLEEALAGEGVHGGEMLPLFAAISFTFKVDTRAVRPGGKRIAGISEEMSVGGQLTATGVPALLLQAADAFSSDISLGGVATFRPIVVKRVDYVVDPGEPTERAGKRLPANIGELVFGNVTTVLHNTNVRHQTTRGNGR